MKNRSRILYISPAAWLYGAERSLYLLAKNIGKTNREAIVMCPGEGALPARLRAEGIAVIVREYSYLSKKNPFPYMKGLFRICKTIKEIDPDIIHCNDSAVCQFSLPISCLLGIPLVTHVRNSERKRFANFEYLSFWAKNVIANSEYIRDGLIESGYKAGNIAVIYNAVEDSLFGLANEKAADALRIGFVGRITEQKGFDVLIKALSGICDHKVQLSIFGDYQGGGFQNQIQGLLDKLPENIAAKHYNYVADQLEIFKNVDLVVVPSRDESFGRVAAEAMAAGLPVIASRIGGLREIVDDGKTGILYEVEDIQGLQKAIKLLAGDPRLRNDMGKEGRKKALKLFSIDEQLRQIDAVYGSLAP